MTSRRSASLRGTILLGIACMPIVFAITFFGLFLATDAEGPGGWSGIEHRILGVFSDSGVISSTDVTVLEISDRTPTPTPFQPLPVDRVYAVEPPSSILSPSQTASPSPTPTPSETPTDTATATATSTPSATPTSSPTQTPSATPSATRTATVTRSPTRTPSRTPTKTSLPSETPTSELLPSQAGPSATPTLPPTASTCAASANAVVEAQVVELVNTERVAQGLAAYTVDSRLTAAARVHATDMACNHFTSHTGSDGSSVRDRVEAQGYAWSWIGENYYVTGNTDNGAQVAFDWWMNSTPHRNNLLSPNYTQFGVGYVYDASSDYGGYFVVVFARPQ